MALSLKQVDKKKKKINQKSLQKSPHSMDKDKDLNTVIDAEVDLGAETDNLHVNIKPWSKELNSPKPKKEIPVEKNLNKPFSSRFKFKIPVPRFFHQKSN